MFAKSVKHGRRGVFHSEYGLRDALPPGPSFGAVGSEPAVSCLGLAAAHTCRGKIKRLLRKRSSASALRAVLAAPLVVRNRFWPLWPTPSCAPCEARRAYHKQRNKEIYLGHQRDFPGSGTPGIPARMHPSSIGRGRGRWAAFFVCAPYGFPPPTTTCRAFFSREECEV